jgi:hypothetical protein
MKQRVFIIVILIVIGLYLLCNVHYLKANDTFQDMTSSRRCGVDLPSCSNSGIRCVNGYCKSDKLPYYPKVSDLPIQPDRYPYSQN